MKKIAVLILSLLLTACSSAQIDQQAYAILLGIEQGDQARYRISIRLADVSADAAKEAPNMLSVQAETLAMGLESINTAYNQNIHLGQTRYIFFSRALTERDDFAALIRALEENPAISPAAGIIVCAQSVQETLGAITPLLSKRLSRALATLEDTMIEQSCIPVTSLHQMANTLSSRYATPLGIFCAIAPGGQTGKQPSSQDSQGDTAAQEKPGDSEQHNSPAQTPEPQSAASEPIPALPQRNDPTFTHKYAGQLAHSGGTSVDFFGAAAFTHDRLGMVLTGYETQLLSMAQGAFSKAVMTFETEHALTDIRIVQAKRSSPAHLTGGDTPCIALSLSLSGHAVSDVQTDLERLSAQIGQQIEQDLYHLLRALYSIGCDPLWVGAAQARQFGTIDAFEAAFDPEALKTAPIAVSVRLQLRTAL